MNRKTFLKTIAGLPILSSLPILSNPSENDTESPGTPTETDGFTALKDGDTLDLRDDEDTLYLLNPKTGVVEKIGPASSNKKPCEIKG